MVLPRLLVTEADSVEVAPVISVGKFPDFCRLQSVLFDLGSSLLVLDLVPSLDSLALATSAHRPLVSTMAKFGLFGWNLSFGSFFSFFILMLKTTKTLHFIRLIG